MQKLYKMKSGLILLIAPVSETEYYRTSEALRGVSWANYLKNSNLTDPSTVKMDDVEKVLFKQSHDLDDCITYLEHEVNLSLAHTALKLDNVRKTPDQPQAIYKYEFHMEKYNSMIILLEKIKLATRAIRKHSLFGEK